MTEMATAIGEVWRSNRNPAILMGRAKAALDMALQPIVDIHTGAVYGFEALVRHFEQLGLTSPHELFDCAHQAGCLHQLDLFLREIALRKFASLPGCDEQRLFYNLDGRVLESANLLTAETERLLTRHHLRPSAFCLELSETYQVSGGSDVDALIAKSRAIGFRFAVDDFGRGYSGLKVLYDYHPDFLKIDRFFITSIQTDSRKRLFVGSVVDLAHILGVKVVAEGVETEAELQTCREIGCDLVQGYFICKPFLELDAAQRAYMHVVKQTKQAKKTRDTDGHLLHSEIKALSTIAEAADVTTVLATFQRHTGQSYFPIVDDNDEPRGIVAEQDLKQFIYLPYGQDLLKNKNFKFDIARFARKCPVADIDSPIEKVIDLIADEMSEGVIVTQNTKYLGFISTNSLLRISNSIRLRQARDQNPLTKLPGNAPILDYIAEACAEGGMDRFLCFVDLDNFKPFNDTYGFSAGDRAILLLADSLQRLQSDRNVFIGHVGGDDFFVGTCSGDREAISDSMLSFRDKFGRNAESLYRPEDRARGFIAAEGRNGMLANFPLLTCSIAVVMLPANAGAVDPEDVVSELARLKRLAKSSGSGLAMAEIGAATERVA